MKKILSLLPKLKTYKLPMFMLLFLCFASAILGDSVAEALILSNFDASVIPRLYMVNALFLFLSSLYIMSLIDRIDRGFFFLIFIFIHSFVLLLIWCAVFFGITFLYIPLFSYAYVTKIFLFLMFWTLANDIIDSRKAGQEFPFIAAGGTLGAICVSFMIPWLLKITSAQNLLLVWCILTFILALVFIPIRQAFGKNFMLVSDSEKHTKRTMKNVVSDIGLLYKEPLLASMSILYFMLFFILLNQHYSFYETIKIRFVEVDQLAGFLGYFNGISMCATFIIQILFAGFVLRKIGSTRSMFMLPAVLCVVFGILTFIALTYSKQKNELPVQVVLFWGIVSGVGLRIAFFDSFFSPNFQIFFSSLPQTIRGRGKLVIEGVVKPLAMVFASLWLLWVTSKLSFGVNMMILFGIAIIMIIQTFRIRLKYTQSLTNYLGDFKTRVFNPMEFTDDKNVLTFLTEKLHNDSREIKYYVIELLTTMNTDKSIDILVEYIKNAESKVRATIITALTKLKRKELQYLFKEMLKDSDERVVANSVLALAAFSDIDINEGLGAFINHRNNRVKANTIFALWSNVNDKQKIKMIAIIYDMLGSDVNDTCLSALFALREIKDKKKAGEILERFYKNRKDIIFSDRLIWRNYLISLEKIVSPELLEDLLKLAPTLNAKKRSDITNCIINTYNNGYSIAPLLSRIDQQDIIIRGILVKVICLLQLEMTKEMEQTFLNIAYATMDEVYRDWSSYNTLLSIKRNSSLQLLKSAIVEEYINERLHNLIYISASLDKSGQVRKVMRRLNHGNKHVRARALEVLDNAGNMKVNRMVIKLIEANDESGNIKDIIDRYPFNTEKVSSIVERYMTGTSKWVKECAEYALATL